jgi:hypothetical protein
MQLGEGGHHLDLTLSHKFLTRKQLLKNLYPPQPMAALPNIYMH